MITLMHGDCLDLMREIEPGSVDLIATDLPYGTTACKWDAVIPFPLLWDNAKRLLKPGGAFLTTSSQPFTSALIMSNPKWFKHGWVWVKDRKTNQMHAKRMPMKGHEEIVVFASISPTYNRQLTPRDKPIPSKTPVSQSVVCSSPKFQKSGYERRTDTICPDTVLFFPTVRGPHPSQKPVDLYEYLIKTYSNPGDTVLDLCMGSGTTGEACVKTGRDFIGIEKERGYFDLASARIDEAVRGTAVPQQSEMFR